MFKKSIKIEYGEAYKVEKDIETENKRLENKVKKLILKGDKIEKTK